MVKTAILLLTGINILFNAGGHYSSTYTDFSRNCTAEKSAGAGSDPLISCPGPGGYRVTIYCSACFEYVRVESRDSRESFVFPEQPVGASSRRNLEWRYFRGKPVGCIFRVDVMVDDSKGNCAKRKTGRQALVVRGLGTYRGLTATIPSDRTANDRARLAVKRFVEKK